MKIIIKIITLFAAIFLLSSCSPENASKPIIIAASYPSYEIARELAGETAEVKLITPSSVDDVEVFSDTSVFISTGSFGAVEDSIADSNPEMKMIKSSDNFKLLGTNQSKEHLHSSSHASMEVPDSMKIPAADFKIHEDKKSGWNIEIFYENITISPEKASSPHVDGQGHAHIYVNGEKINRVYGNWYHLGNLEPGTNEIKITLSSNNHSEFRVGGKPVGAAKKITVDLTKGHSHTGTAMKKDVYYETCGYVTNKDMKAMAEEILKGLTSIYPENSEIYSENFDRYVKRFDSGENTA